MRPLPAARQQATLLLSQRMLSLGSWSLSTALQRRLAPDRLEPSEAGNATELRLAQALLARQHAVINFFTTNLPAASSPMQPDSIRSNLFSAWLSSTPN